MDPYVFWAGDCPVLRSGTPVGFRIIGRVGMKRGGWSYGTPVGFRIIGRVGMKRGGWSYGAPSGVRILGRVWDEAGRLVVWQGDVDLAWCGQRGACDDVVNG